MIQEVRHYLYQLELSHVFASYRSTVDCGDYVVVTNARKIKVTGKKHEQIVYRRHTMFPGGLKEIQYKDMMAKKPDEVRCDHLVFPVCSCSTCRSSDRQYQACFPRIG